MARASPNRSSRLSEASLDVNQRRLASAATAWWALVTIAILAASAWLRTPSVQYLAVGGIATAVAVALLWQRTRQSPWMWATMVALATAHLVAIPAQLDLRRISSHWDEWQQAAGERALTSATTALDAAVADARAAVNAALAAPATPAAAFEALAPHGKGFYDRGVVLLENGQPFAWLHGSLRSDGAMNRSPQK